MKGNYNDSPKDPTLWFAFVDEERFLGDYATEEKVMPQRRVTTAKKSPQDYGNFPTGGCGKIPIGYGENPTGCGKIPNTLITTDAVTDAVTDKHGAGAPACPAAAVNSSVSQTPTAAQAVLEATPTAFAEEPQRVRSKSVDFLMAKGVEYQVAVDWMVARKTKQVTPTVWSLVAEEAEKAGITPVAAVKWAAGRGNANFMADWYTPETQKTSAPAGYTKYPPKPNLMDENRAAAAAYMAERNARMGVEQAKDMGEIEQVPPSQNDFFGDNWEPA
jgi:hypothetical protein